MNKNITSYVRSINDGKENYYTKIDNRLIKSENLSCVEKMIIIHSLSQNDSYGIIKAVIRNQLGLGVKNFTKAWKNLEKLGCIEDYGQTCINGRFGSKEFVINEYSDILMKLEKVNSTKKQEVMDDIYSENNTSGTVDTLVHDGKVLNVKSTDGNQIDAEVYIAKETSNNKQDNQNQFNQYQPNELKTNDFDENQNSWADQVILSLTNTDYNLEAKDYIEDFLGCDFHYGWYNYDREIEFRTNEDKEIFEGLNKQDQAWLSKLYLWLLFVNEKYFKFNIENWKLNKKDMDDLYIATGNLNLQGDGWEDVFQIINSIAENAYAINKEYISVSYLTKQLKGNSCYS